MMNWCKFDERSFVGNFFRKCQSKFAGRTRQLEIAPMSGSVARTHFGADLRRDFSACASFSAFSIDSRFLKIVNHPAPFCMLGAFFYFSSSIFCEVNTIFPSRIRENSPRPAVAEGVLEEWCSALVCNLESWQLSMFSPLKTNGLAWDAKNERRLFLGVKSMYSYKLSSWLKDQIHSSESVFASPTYPQPSFPPFSGFFYRLPCFFFLFFRSDFQSET